MLLNIKYFGLLSEITGCHEEAIDFNGSTLYELMDLVFEKYPELERKDFQLAHNNEIVSGDMKLINNEIAFLPPFSGG
ncbi:molybdopterin synthase sulfur carrier subunit [Flavobacteriaceae bacterium MAR_2010_72]|nr:molybdopterin synthase sulfur carrier subunit [Flavobacteriaceae bacterium MAR_2010_72]TVZ59511.1 molybdopterin synthase sulfur carrier subunit [Flavobacteriaceae bacterium MAR_2010_105]